MPAAGLEGLRADGAEDRPPPPARAECGVELSDRLGVGVARDGVADGRGTAPPGRGGHGSQDVDGTTAARRVSVGEAGRGV